MFRLDYARKFIKEVCEWYFKLKEIRKGIKARLFRSSVIVVFGINIILFCKTRNIFVCWKCLKKSLVFLLEVAYSREFGQPLAVATGQAPVLCVSVNRYRRNLQFIARTELQGWEALWGRILLVVCRYLLGDNRRILCSF